MENQEQPTRGIGIIVEAGMVTLHFFAIEMAVQMSAAEAHNFGLHLIDAAAHAPGSPEAPAVKRNPDGSLILEQ